MSFGVLLACGAAATFSAASLFGVASVLVLMKGQSRHVQAMMTRVDDEWFELAKSHNELWKDAMERMKVLLDREKELNDRLNKELLLEKANTGSWCSLAHDELEDRRP